MPNEFGLLALAGLDLLLARVSQSLENLKNENYWLGNLDEVAKRRFSRMASFWQDMIDFGDNIENGEILEPDSLALADQFKFILGLGVEPPDWQENRITLLRAKDLCEFLSKNNSRVSPKSLDWLQEMIKNLKVSLHNYLVQYLYS